jgi:drug/metabolite transporter (DMT)-like permease
MPSPRARPTGVAYALLAAALFGASTPCAKLLLARVHPVMVAGLLYLGAGLGLGLVHVVRRCGGREAARLRRADAPWLAGAVLAGGVLAPLLLMLGLRATPATTASLLLNLEGVFTAVLAWRAFREHADRRLVLGVGLIVVAGALLAWQGGVAGAGRWWGPALIAGACLLWGVDNNLTQRISASDPVQIVAIKGSVAGAVNVAIALSVGAHWPQAAVLGAAAALGLASYGVSLVLYVVALRHLGTARTGAYFATAPFVGAAASLALLHEPVGRAFVPAAGLMAVGLWLHLAEGHAHRHTHERLEHTHAHGHDAHHRHAHPPGTAAVDGHTHPHVHEPQTHAHPHYPDIHHRHRH